MVQNQIVQAQIAQNSPITFEYCTPGTSSFHQLCSYFGNSYQEIKQSCDSGVQQFWALVKAGKVIGYAQKTKITSISECILAVGDSEIAQGLWNSSTLYELRYHISQPQRGCGLGSKYIVPWLVAQRTQKCADSVCRLFAQVASSNRASTSILQKAGFIFQKSFFQSEMISIYVPSSEAFCNSS